MKDTDVAARTKTGLIISDNDRLGRAIALVLNNCLGVEMMELTLDSLAAWQSQDADLKLIVLALSSAESEPLVLLSRASLVAKIDRVPLVIVSEQAVFPDLGGHVFHVDFPYDPRKLCNRVNEILRASPENPQARGAQTRTALLRTPIKLLPRVESGNL